MYLRIIEYKIYFYLCSIGYNILRNILRLSCNHYLCLKVKGKTKEEQLSCTVDLYDQMVLWYRTFLETSNGKECIEEFDRILPEYTWMSSVKKIDFYLWSIRE